MRLEHVGGQLDLARLLDERQRVGPPSRCGCDANGSASSRATPAAYATGTWRRQRHRFDGSTRPHFRFIHSRRRTRARDRRLRYAAAAISSTCAPSVDEKPNTSPRIQVTR